MDNLPAWVHDAFDNVEVLVADEADDNLEPDGQGLLGLYVGTPLPERGVEYAGRMNRRRGYRSGTRPTLTRFCC